MDHIRNLLGQIAIISKKNAEILDASGGRFNIFKVCGVNHYENIHSAILAEFLNPKGSHGLKSKLLECFIDMFCSDAIKQHFKVEHACVHTEYSTREGRMDIVIEDRTNHALIIENKIYAGDQGAQLKRYNTFAQKEYSKGIYQIFYFTLWGDEASEQSGKNVEYTCISYYTDIIAWLEKCVCISVHFPTVRETINQYINHLKSLTNQDMNAKNQEEVVEILSKPENIESAFTIASNITTLKNHLINKVFIPQLSSICEELDLKDQSGESDRVNTRWAGFRILNPSWKVFDIGFEFGNIGLRSFIIGLNRIDRSDLKNDETVEKLKSFFPRRSPLWVYKSFPKYPDWDKEAMIAIANGEMADIFKNEITKILEFTKEQELNM
jgi:hypothetical protein